MSNTSFVHHHSNCDIMWRNFVCSDVIPLNASWHSFDSSGRNGDTGQFASAASSELASSVALTRVVRRFVMALSHCVVKNLQKNFPAPLHLRSRRWSSM